jgi:hypothetical protein
MTHRNRELLVAAARVLQPLAGELVFVGGTATGLMITDAAAADARSTYDVDVIAEIASYSEYRVLGKRLRWYPEAMISSKWEELEQGIKIRVVTPPYFCGTKLVAFRDVDAAITRPATIWKTSSRSLTVGSNSLARSRRRSSMSAPTSLRRLALCFALHVFSTRSRDTCCPMLLVRRDTMSSSRACAPLRHSDRAESISAGGTRRSLATTAGRCADGSAGGCDLAGPWCEVAAGVRRRSRHVRLGRLPLDLRLLRFIQTSVPLPCCGCEPAVANMSNLTYVVG